MLNSEIVCVLAIDYMYVSRAGTLCLNAKSHVCLLLSEPLEPCVPCASKPECPELEPYVSNLEQCVAWNHVTSEHGALLVYASYLMEPCVSVSAWFCVCVR